MVDMMDGEVESSRVRRLRAKIDRVKSKVSGGVEGLCDGVSLGGVPPQGGAEAVPFKETFNGRQLSEQLKDITRTCGVGLSDEFIETSLGAARDAWYRGEKSSFKKYCAEDHEVLRASRDYLNQSHYLKPSLYPLLWELAKEFRATVARAYEELLPEPLTYNDIDPRKAIERFMIPSHPKKDPPALDGDDSGVRTRLRRAQEELFQADDSAKQRPERKSSLKRENSYTLSAKNPNSGRLFRSKEMMLARKRGAHCGLCPPLEREEEEQLMTELVGPFPKRDGSMSLFVHLECLLWAPEVYTDGHGNFRMVYEVYNRGRKLVCATCGVKGATIGCYVESCRKSYHFACLKKGSCRLVEEHFVCFCPKHRGRADTAIFKQIIRWVIGQYLCEGKKRKAKKNLSSADNVSTFFLRGGQCGIGRCEGQNRGKGGYNVWIGYAAFLFYGTAQGPTGSHLLPSMGCHNYSERRKRGRIFVLS
mmetsp:Transcript_35947/g.143690  ORF Transcript_35947/g.143690 Transcript_35947/m.143690 type:complete len:476 (-) Transcript_35947:1739-3166(-)